MATNSAELVSECRIFKKMTFCTIYKKRGRLGKMYKLYNSNKLVYENIDISKISFCAYLSIGNSYRYIKYLNNRLNKIIKEK